MGVLVQESQCVEFGVGAGERAGFHELLVFVFFLAVDSHFAENLAEVVIGAQKYSVLSRYIFCAGVSRPHGHHSLERVLEGSGLS